MADFRNLFGVPVSSSILNPGEFLIGQRAGVSAPMVGTIDELTVWNRVLTPAEVAEDYNSGVPTNPRNLSTANALLLWHRFGSNVPQ